MTKSGVFDTIYALVSRIPPGKVMTYGLISEYLDGRCSARYVGFAMAAAPAALDLPCHRVVNRLGEMAPGAIFGGQEAQRELLRAEGAVFKPDGRLDLQACLYRPSEDEKSGQKPSSA